MKIYRNIPAVLAAAAAMGGGLLLVPGRSGAQYASPVNVMNAKSAAAWTRDAENPVRNHFAGMVTVVAGNGVNTACANAFVSSPGIMVVEQVSALSQSAPQIDSADIRPVTNGLATIFPLEVDHVSTFPTAYRQLRVYQDPSTPPKFCFTRPNATGSGSVDFYFSGYIINP